MGSTIISLRTRPEQLASKLEEIDNRMEFYNAVVKVIEAADQVNERAHKKFVIPVANKVWQSFLDVDFLDQYSDFFNQGTTWDVAKPLIERLIGKVDPASKKRALRKKLSGMTRQSERKEPFWQFLSRLQSVASQVWTDTTARAEAVEQVWLDSLRPMDKAHLAHMVQPTNTDTMAILEAQAAYLDRGKMYKRTSDTRAVAHLEQASSSSNPMGYQRRSYDRDEPPSPQKPKSDQSTEIASLIGVVDKLVLAQSDFQEEFRKQRLEDRGRMDMLEAQLNSISSGGLHHAHSPSYASAAGVNQLEGWQQSMIHKQDQMDRQIRALQSNKARSEPKQPQAQQTAPRPKTQSQKGKSRKYDPCFTCGLNGHKKAECKGTQLFCNYCGKQGHIQSSRQYHPEINKYIGLN